jgi:hypothetical protein
VRALARAASPAGALRLSLAAGDEVGLKFDVNAGWWFNLILICSRLRHSV